MKPRRLSRILLFPCLFTACFGNLSFSKEPASLADSNLPLPPQQSETWTPPASKLPSALVDAIAKLFDQGLADPRGCEYREVEIKVGTCWGDGGIIKTNTWVLPSPNQKRFAVSWSGLVYPVVSVGAPADWRADVSQMLAADQEQLDKAKAQHDQSENERENNAKRKGEKYQRTDWPLRWNKSAISESENVIPGSMRPLKVALLLRLGEVESAEKIWKQWSNVTQQSPNEDPYMMLANDWVWSLLDRSLGAHMRGDDQLAWADAKTLTALQPKLEAEAAARKIPKQRNSEDPKQFIPYFPFLEPLSDLAADSERRLKEPAFIPVLQTVPPPAGKERIKSLICDLELVSARQHSQPGGVDLASDPIVNALIQSGNDAVEPLLACLETDTRLTRSVRFHRDFSTYRTILGTHEAAYVALSGILQSNFFGVASTADSLTARGSEGRKQVADSIRAYWQKYKDLSVEDRWYLTLADDQAKPEEWLQAGAGIVRDADIEISPGSMFGTGWTSIPNRKAGFTPPMRGEILRSRTNPSVSDLLLKRMKQFQIPESETPNENLRTKIDLAKILSKWDGKSHLDELRKFSSVLKDRYQSTENYHDQNASNVLALYRARLRAGDPEALADYATWLPTVKRDHFDSVVTQLFEIMWQHPDDPAITKSAEKLFKDQDSPWAPQKGSKSSSYGQILASPLVGMPSFRAGLLSALHDKKEVGSAPLGINGGYTISVDDGWSGGGDYYDQDPLAPSEGSSVRFRLCDLYANHLSRLPGAPRCALYWPETQRDQAVKACIGFLQKYGDLFRFQKGDSEESRGYRDTADLHFPKLEQPATSEDVEKNQAIFALHGESRLWPLPSFPMEAVWTTLKDNPGHGMTFDEKGNTSKVTVYNNRGKVFQAEEVLVNGKWERFFGFVSAHRIDKVPAAEIEFPSPAMFPLSSGFEFSLTEPNKPPQFGRAPEEKTPLADPMFISLKIRNRSGLDQKVPLQLIQKTGDKKSLPPGLSLVLEYTDKTATESNSNRQTVWQVVPPKPGHSVSPPGTDEIILAPTQETILFKLDLKDIFDISGSGLYRAQVIFNDFQGSTGKSGHVFFNRSGN